MGLNFLDTQLLIGARRAGHAFGRTLMIGRLSLNLHHSEVRSLCRSGSDLTPIADALHGYKFGDWADRLLQVGLGADQLHVLDYSSYQGAGLIHDLIQPVPDAWLSRYDVVIEAGSLEHVFNVATALKNLMGMVRIGGLLLIKSPSNNLCGHGFYQFSPEFMFRALTEQNGYHVERAIMVEGRYPSVQAATFRRAYEVCDPLKMGLRVGLVNKRPVELIVLARRTADANIFDKFPLQSDYVAVWRGRGVSRGTRMTPRISRVLTVIPSAIRQPALGLKQLWDWSWRNRRAYRRVRARDFLVRLHPTISTGVDR
jgi:hypothetical protein